MKKPMATMLAAIMMVSLLAGCCAASAPVSAKTETPAAASPASAPVSSDEDVKAEVPLSMSHRMTASHSINVTANEFARLVKETSQSKISMFIGTISAAIIMVPIFYPIAETVGIDGLHFGIVMVMTFILGGITSPVSGTLFIATTVAIIKFVNLLKEMWPFILLFLLVLFSVAYFPAIGLWIPSLVG